MAMRSAKGSGSTEATRSDAAVFEQTHRAQTPVFGRHTLACSGFRPENRRTGALTVVSLLLLSVYAGCQGCMRMGA